MHPHLGVVALMHFSVLVCLSEEKVFTCPAKFLGHSALNSVRSTRPPIFLIGLKSLEETCGAALSVTNMNFCMSCSF